MKNSKILSIAAFLTSVAAQAQLLPSGSIAGGGGPGPQFPQQGAPQYFQQPTMPTQVAGGVVYQQSQGMGEQASYVAAGNNCGLARNGNTRLVNQGGVVTPDMGAHY